MTQRLCDRCGKLMKEDDVVTNANGYVIIRVKGGDINQAWDALDLCGDCRESLARWLKAEDKPSALLF